MGVVSRLRHIIDADDALYECRHCGANLEVGAERCHRCDSAEVARYEF